MKSIDKHRLCADRNNGKINYTFCFRARMRENKMLIISKILFSPLLSFSGTCKVEDCCLPPRNISSLLMVYIRDIDAVHFKRIVPSIKCLSLATKLRLRLDVSSPSSCSVVEYSVSNSPGSICNAKKVISVNKDADRKKSRQGKDSGTGVPVIRSQAACFTSGKYKHDVS